MLFNKEKNIKTQQKKSISHIFFSSSVSHTKFYIRYIFFYAITNTLTCTHTNLWAMH